MRGRTATKKKKVLATRVLKQEPSGCSFCGVKDGHRIGSFPKKRPHEKHLIKSEVGSLIETLHGVSLLTCGEYMEENFILQKLRIKE